MWRVSRDKNLERKWRGFDQRIFLFQIDRLFKRNGLNIFDAGLAGQFDRYFSRRKFLWNIKIGEFLIALVRI